MPEEGLTTLAAARRQVCVRELVGSLLILLAVIFLLLFAVKHVYVNLTYFPFFAIPGENLRRLIDPILRAWPVLDLLWRAIPPGSRSAPSRQLCSGNMCMPSGTPWS
jgi:hypothetical protein